MKEPLLSAVVANESEPSVTNESLDSTARHPSLLERIGAQRDPDIKFRSSAASLRNQPKIRPSSKAHRFERVGTYFTLTVITWQAPATVLCRSSPSCSASLCLPGE